MINTFYRFIYIHILIKYYLWIHREWKLYRKFANILRRNTRKQLLNKRMFWCSWEESYELQNLSKHKLVDAAIIQQKGEKCDPDVDIQGQGWLGYTTRWAHGRHSDLAQNGYKKTKKIMCFWLDRDCVAVRYAEEPMVIRFTL